MTRYIWKYSIPRTERKMKLLRKKERKRRIFLGRITNSQERKETMNQCAIRAWGKTEMGKKIKEGEQQERKNKGETILFIFFYWINLGWTAGHIQGKVVNKLLWWRRDENDVHICMHTHIHTRTCTHTGIHACTRTCMHAHTHTHTTPHTHKQPHTHTPTHPHTHACFLWLSLYQLTVRSAIFNAPYKSVLHLPSGHFGDWH